jgi:hypothetical protein
MPTPSANAASGREHRCSSRPSVGLAASVAKRATAGSATATRDPGSSCSAGCGLACRRRLSCGQVESWQRRTRAVMRPRRRSKSVATMPA